MVKELWKSQNEDRFWVPYGRLLSEIFHQGGIIEALSQTRFYNDQMLETVVGKVINGKTLKHMQLIKRSTPLSSDLKESMVVSDLMANFPPVCKKDSLAVQMALLSDHYANTGEKKGLMKSLKTCQEANCLWRKAGKPREKSLLRRST